MAALWRGYLRMLDKFPLRTMSSTTGTLMAAGDGISQFAIEKRDLTKYDSGRSLRFFAFGLLVMGPAMRGWYQLLDKIYKGSRGAPLKMMLTDQSLFAPTITLTFISGMGCLRGETGTEIKQKVKRDFVPIMLANYKVWPAAQLINFYLLPLQHRVLFVNFVALGWNTYLAWVAEK